MAAELAWGEPFMGSCLCRRPDHQGRGKDWDCCEKLDLPDEELDAIDCACDGQSGCAICGGGGAIVLRSCPYQSVDRRARKVCEGVLWAENSVLPAPGGWRNQAASFLFAAAIAMNRRAKIEKAKSGKGKR